MLRCNETLSRDVLNALTARIAVLDERGIIVDVNDAWSRFASDHGAAGDVEGHRIAHVQAQRLGEPLFHAQ